MITKGQAQKMSAALDAIRKKIGYDPSKPYRWSICLDFTNHKGFMITRYSSVVSGFGFISRHDAKEFINDPEGLRLLKEMYGITD